MADGVQLGVICRGIPVDPVSGEPVEGKLYLNFLGHDRVYSIKPLNIDGLPSPADIENAAGLAIAITLSTEETKDLTVSYEWSAGEEVLHSCTIKPIYAEIVSNRLYTLLVVWSNDGFLPKATILPA